jgi:hypothetical protein
MFPMIPVNPSSVKYPPDLRNRVAKNAARMKYTFSHYVRECAIAIDEMLEDETLERPQLVKMLMAARARESETPDPTSNSTDVPK